MAFKSGFVTIIGRPNVGKSTFLNNVIGRKIAITSPKAQTTRNQISGVYTTDNEQIVFIDTPGIHKPKHKLGVFMTDTAIQTLNEVDIVMFMINGQEDLGKGDRYIIEQLEKVNKPVFLLINQIDELDKAKVFKKISVYKDLYNFAEIIPISALRKLNIETLVNVISSYLEEGPKYYPDDQLTDHPEKFIIAETVREKVLYLTKEEVPHSIATVVESVKRDEDDKLVVTVIIFVERSGQKGIIIGKQGQMLKTIGTRARRDIESLLGEKIHLELWVKIEPNWRNKAKYLKQLGYAEEM
jgi:GTP-binding protein Era